MNTSSFADGELTTSVVDAGKSEPALTTNGDFVVSLVTTEISQSGKTSQSGATNDGPVTPLITLASDDIVPKQLEVVSTSNVAVTLASERVPGTVPAAAATAAAEATATSRVPVLLMFALF